MLHHGEGKEEVPASPQRIKSSGNQNLPEAPAHGAEAVLPQRSLERPQGAPIHWGRELTAHPVLPEG